MRSAPVAASEIAPNNQRPALFVSCSKEQKALAYAIQQELDHDVEVTLWTQGFFAPSGYTVDELIRQLPRFDFGVFLFTADDMLEKRNMTYAAPRDNVIFELGMFFGRLGRERCFILSPRHRQVGMPSDLLGIATLDYDENRSDSNLRAAVGPACNEIRNAVLQYGALQLAASAPQGQASPRQALSASQRKHIEDTIYALATSGTGPTCLIFFDIDRFEALNRWYGTEACDQIITAVEEILAATCSSAFQTRIGGDQFLLCLRNVTTAQAKTIARECVLAVKQWHWPIIAPHLYVTLSAGTAPYKAGETATRWILRAIHGSINAKRQGGNSAGDAPTTLSKQSGEDYTSLLS
jgi:diguanylate cyclase (GGDEF)-like protein